MPRYFFTFPQHGDPDLEGEELLDDNSARDLADDIAREKLCDGIMAGWDMTDWKMTVTDEGGQILLEVPLWPLASTSAMSIR